MAADFVCLLRGDVPSAKTQHDMAAWRMSMTERLRSLAVHKASRKGRVVQGSTGPREFVVVDD